MASINLEMQCLFKHFTCSYTQPVTYIYICYIYDDNVVIARRLFNDCFEEKKCNVDVRDGRWAWLTEFMTVLKWRVLLLSVILSSRLRCGFIFVLCDVIVNILLGRYFDFDQ